MPSSSIESDLLRELGLRRQSTRLHFTGRSKWIGYLLMGSSFFFGFLFFYAGFLSKIFPYTQIYILDQIKDDYYFCYLIPLSIIPTYMVLYLNWLSRVHFVQN